MNSLEDTQDKTLRIKFFQMRLYLKCTDGLKGEKLTGVYRMCKWESVFFCFLFFVFCFCFLARFFANLAIKALFLLQTQFSLILA